MNTNNVLEKIKQDKIINLIKMHLKDTQTYLVGGVLRDFFLNKENFDKDIIVTDKCAKDVALKLSKELNATFVPLDEEYKIYRIVLEDKINYIDIANIIGKNLEDDLERRDLTINSIAFNLNKMEFLDLNNGIRDIKDKKIRHIKKGNMVDDPLRMLRAYRFQSSLCFEMDEELQELICNNSQKINEPAVERINYELLKLFSGENCANCLLSMDNSGMLTELIPFIKELKLVPPNSHHHLNLFMHSIEVIKQIQFLYRNSTPEVKKHLDSVEFGGNTRLAHLKLAGLLHDIGKHSTWTIEEETGKHRFIKHDDVGAKMAQQFLKKNKYSKKQIEYICKMIKFHIYPSHVVQTPSLSEKNYMRMIRKMDKDFIDIIILAQADRLSARGEEITDEVIKKNLDSLNVALDYYLNMKDSIKPLPKLLSGLEIIEILKIKPSVELGQIIKKLHEEQLSGNINTKEEAISFISRQKND